VGKKEPKEGGAGGSSPGKVTLSEKKKRGGEYPNQKPKKQERAEFLKAPLIKGMRVLGGKKKPSRNDTLHAGGKKRRQRKKKSHWGKMYTRGGCLNGREGGPRHY